MAIRRVTGAVSPSELIFADANALGATYDGSGTTIERGETFTLPAAGTTAVSNGALRLEALKGDCTITNNGNSTLTNASGVDGTILMRSGASEFPAYVKNSSMGSMEVPAREDFTGSLIGAGTFDGTVSGTLSSTTTTPTSISSCEKLYSNSASGVASVSIDGYFDDTKYGFYELHLQDVRLTNSSSDRHLIGRVNIGGEEVKAHEYWTSGHGAYSNNGSGSAMTRADSDGTVAGADYGYFYMDHTWYMVGSGNTDRTTNYILRFNQPQRSSRYFQCMIEFFGNAHNETNDYDSWSGFNHLSVTREQPITGFTFFMNNTTTSVLSINTIILYGYRI